MTGPLPGRAEYVAAWRRLHGGYDPGESRLVTSWLSLTYYLAVPLARGGVRPDVVTWCGAGSSAVAVGMSVAGDRWLVGAALLVLLSGLLDGLDGAIAVLTDRATRWGYVLDSVVDRIVDGLYLLALWVGGAAGWVCVAGGAVTGLQEYARARAGAGGMTEVGVITVWERPTRVLVTALFLLGGGLYRDVTWVTSGALAWLVLAIVGFGQLALMLRRRLH